MATAVNIYVKDDSVSTAAITGVIVNIYNAINFTLVASATSDGTGKAVFLIPGNTTPGLTYEVRLYKLGVLFANPKAIQVVEPVVTTNDFDVSGTLLTLEPATDPKCCRCTGRFLDYSNRPIINTLIRIMAQGDIKGQIPKVVDGNLISLEAMNLRTDSNGFIKVELLRKGQYWVMFSGEDDTVVPITVPDRTSVNLIDLMYPQPVSFAWDQTIAPSNAVPVPLNTTILVPGTITFSDYSTLSSSLGSWLVFTPTNSAIVSVGDAATSLPLSGKLAGSTTITVSLASGLLPVRIPTYTITSTPLTVTVT